MGNSLISSINPQEIIKTFGTWGTSAAEKFTSSLNTDRSLQDLVKRICVVTFIIFCSGTFLKYCINKFYHHPRTRSAPPSIIPPAPSIPSTPSALSMSSVSVIFSAPAMYWIYSIFSVHSGPSMHSAPQASASAGSASFNFEGLPRDLRGYLINFLSSPEDILNLSLAGPLTYGVVISCHQLWRRNYERKYKEQFPIIKANDQFNGSEAIKFIRQMRAQKWQIEQSSEAPRLYQDPQQLKLGGNAVNFQVNVDVQSINRRIRIHKDGEERVSFKITDDIDLDFSNYSILDTEDRIYLATKTQIFILCPSFRERNQRVAIPGWATFHELILFGNSLCVAVSGNSVEGTGYYYYFIDLLKEIPQVLSSEYCARFNFGGNSPLKFFKHPYIENRLFFYPQDIEPEDSLLSRLLHRSSNRGQPIYMLEQVTDPSIPTCAEIVKHPHSIGHAAFTSDGRKLIIQDKPA